MSTLVARPGGVTFVAVLVWLQGAFDIIAGVALLFLQNDPQLKLQFGSQAAVVTAGVFYILLGVVVVAVAGGLLRGSNGARIIVTIVQVASIASAVFLIFLVPVHFGTALVSGLWALFILLLLWSGRAALFFRS